MSVADEVEELAKKHGIDVAIGEAAWLALQFAHLSEGGATADRTMLLIADLMRDEFTSGELGSDLLLRHIRERPNDD
ncbi:hypothetical protein HFO98_02810 [Rhizobium leguminosarum]|uniref:hypothetical protein n=1 Tax=Rhizobium leguminosarum TaxID=384 RepID=UPI001C9787A4|nr:hypothetical protein [Rhizobium leguminosarum]MBY5407411.1 hypothetical protein [Rhizobium leguminosarum]